VRDWLAAPDPVPEAEIQEALRRISQVYPYASAAKSPVKLSVSELKRREQDESRYGEDQVMDLPVQDPALGINLDLHDLSDLTEIGQQPVQGARLGTALAPVPALPGPAQGPARGQPRGTGPPIGSARTGAGFICR